MLNPSPLATLVLEDGIVLQGDAFGAHAERVFELVFNTSLTGYQEIITDPSYRGQGVLFTATHIGNVGINPEDYESAMPQVSALVVRALSPVVSNWRANLSLSDWMVQHNTPGISGADTRYLTRKLREQGTQKAALSTCGTPQEKLLEMARQWPGLDGRDMVGEVTCMEAYAWEGDRASHWVKGEAGPSTPDQPLVVVYDFGLKRNILRSLAACGRRVRVVPAFTPAGEVLQLHPEAVVLSNGPGDPAGLPYAVETTHQLIESGTPVLGICLGHQLLGLALGGRTGRLKFGHHGGNHPVMDLHSGRTWITAQNHNYHVEIESLPASQVEVTHLSLNDGSLEGMRLRNRPVFSVQFHPEAAPGPHDAQGVFRGFFEWISPARPAVQKVD